MAISEMVKSISLRQISIQSGVNYITLRNIQTNKQDRVTSKVANKIESFYLQFDPVRMINSAPRRGRKPLALPNRPMAEKKSKVPTVHPDDNNQNSSSIDEIFELDTDRLAILNVDHLISEKRAELEFLLGIRTAQQEFKKSIPSSA
jgi:lambda repressor-like predicted transcriptional regulator